MWKFIRAIGEHARALNRFAALWEAFNEEENADRVAILRQANTRSTQAMDRMEQAIDQYNQP